LIKGIKIWKYFKLAKNFLEVVNSVGDLIDVDGEFITSKINFMKEEIEITKKK